MNKFIQECTKIRQIAKKYFNIIFLVQHCKGNVSIQTMLSFKEGEKSYINKNLASTIA